MTRRLVIAVDCDDVLMPTAQAIADDYYRRFGVRVDLKDFYEPASHKSWGADSDEEVIERVAQFLRSKEHAELVPFPEAVMAVKTLAKNHELHLVSGRVDHLRPVTERMLSTHFPECFRSIEHTNFIVSSTSKAQRRSKGEVCRSIGADILVDDHFHHVQNVLTADVGRAILFGNYPWSQKEELLAGMVRCADWPAVIEEVERYAAR